MNTNAAVTETLTGVSMRGGDNAVGIATMLCAGGSGVHIPAEALDFSIFFRYSSSSFDPTASGPYMTHPFLQVQREK